MTVVPEPGIENNAVIDSVGPACMNSLSTIDPAEYVLPQVNTIANAFIVRVIAHLLNLSTRNRVISVLLMQVA